MIIEEEHKNEKSKENKPQTNNNPFVQRNQKRDFNIVYRNKVEKPMTVCELFGLNKESEKREEKVTAEEKQVQEKEVKKVKETVSEEKIKIEKVEVNTNENKANKTPQENK